VQIPLIKGIATYSDKATSYRISHDSSTLADTENHKATGLPIRGKFRVSRTYDAPTAGKTTAHTDTYL